MKNEFHQMIGHIALLIGIILTIGSILILMITLFYEW